MKILHISEKADGGGAESVFRETIVLLKDLDKERSHYIACKASENLPFKIDFPFKSNKVNSLDLIYSFENRRQLDIFLAELEPDLIHLHHYANLSPSVLSSLYKFKKRRPEVKIVQTVHTFEYLCSHHAAFDYKKSMRCLDCGKQRFKTKIFYRNCSRLGYMHSIGKGINSLIAHYYYGRNVIDLLIVPSEFMKETIAQNNRFESEKIFIVENPVAKSFIHERACLNKKNQIIYFGRLSDEKNIELLVRAYAQYIVNSIEPYTLLIVGEGPDSVMLQNLVRELNLEDNVRFLPFLQHAELSVHLQESKISVLPSKCFENAPMMVIESLAFDILPIVSSHGGMKEMVTKFNFGLTFKSDSVSSLSEIINYAVEHNAELVRNTKNARLIAGQLLTSERYLRNLDNIYRLISN
jgi:glycosyltransferase involved in cell wall biosynthesis